MLDPKEAALVAMMKEKITWMTSLGYFLLENVAPTEIECRIGNTGITIIFDPETTENVYRRRTELKNLMGTPLEEGQPPRWVVRPTGYSNSFYVEIPIQFHRKNVTA